MTEMNGDGVDTCDWKSVASDDSHVGTLQQEEHAVEQDPHVVIPYDLIQENFYSHPVPIRPSARTEAQVHTEEVIDRLFDHPDSKFHKWETTFLAKLQEQLEGNLLERLGQILDTKLERFSRAKTLEKDHPRPNWPRRLSEQNVMNILVSGTFLLPFFLFLGCSYAKR